MFQNLLKTSYSSGRLCLHVEETIIQSKVCTKKKCLSVFATAFVQNTVHANKYRWQSRQHSRYSQYSRYSHKATGRMNCGLNPDRVKKCSSLNQQNWFCGSLSILVNPSCGALHWQWSSQHIRLTTHPHPVPMLRMSRDIPALPIYTFMVLAWMTLPLPVLISSAWEVCRNTSTVPVAAAAADSFNQDCNVLTCYS
jgi:hypothetical protein